MADRDSRLLREGKERELIVSTVKTKIGFRQVKEVLQKRSRRVFVINDELIWTLELQGFYFGELKAKVIFQDFASDVIGDVYWLDTVELREFPAKWLL